MSIRIADLLKRLPPETEERVDRARKQAGAALRDAVRQETGLHLQRRSGESAARTDHISVPVSLEPGYPEELEDFSFPDEFRLALIIAKYRWHLRAVAEAGQPLDALCGELEADAKGVELLRGRRPSVRASAELARELLQLLVKTDPVSRILSVNEDILGVYRYQVPRQQAFLLEDTPSGQIILYWGIIGLVAGFMGVPPEDLTVVVLAHELGHAYTHLGADIDGQRWDTNAFHRSERGLKEGLAQYYTDRACRRIQNPFPRAFEVYKELLTHQPKDYKTHVPWVEGHTPEEVRLAMIETRRKNHTSVAQFTTALTTALDRLRKAKS